MTNVPRGKEHFNLYYIFKEDKEQKSLAKKVVEKLYINALLRIDGLKPPE